MSTHPKDHTKPKACRTCGVVKNPDEFYVINRGKGREHLPPGRRADCIPCTSINVKKKFESLSEEEKEERRYSKRKWHYGNPEKSRERAKRGHLKQYDLTLEQYEEMLKTQGGVCLLCKKPETLKSVSKNKIITRSLAVDHCHKTGRVRGLLCGKCNKALGLFNDSTELLSKAISYLRNVKEKL